MRVELCNEHECYINNQTLLHLLHSQSHLHLLHFLWFLVPESSMAINKWLNIIVDGNSALRTYWPNILSHFLEKILRLLLKKIIFSSNFIL